MRESGDGPTNQAAPPGPGRLALPGVAGFAAVVLATILFDQVDPLWVGDACKVLYPCLALAAIVCAVVAIRRYLSRSPRSRGLVTLLVVLVNLSFATAAFFLMRIMLFGRN